MGRVMLMRKVTRMAEMEGEKDQAAQLLSQVPLEAIFLSSVDCRKDIECLWFDFRGVRSYDSIHRFAGCPCLASNKVKGLPTPASSIQQRRHSKPFDREQACSSSAVFACP